MSHIKNLKSLYYINYGVFNKIDIFIFSFDLHILDPKAELLQLKLIHLFARKLFLMKKLEIKKTKPTFIISVLKVEY